MSTSFSRLKEKKNNINLHDATPYESTGLSFDCNDEIHVSLLKMRKSQKLMAALRDWEALLQETGTNALSLNLKGLRPSISHEDKK